MSEDRNVSDSDRRIRNFSEGKYRLTLSEVPVSPLSVDDVFFFFFFFFLLLFIPL